MPAGPAVLRFSRGLPPSKQFGERLRLLVVEGQDKGTCYSVLGDSAYIGREGCQILLTDTNISKKHAELGWAGDHYFLRDLGSANGILHNGQRVTEAKLTAGDVVVMGVTVIEIYPPGQSRRSDRALLPGGARRPALKAAGGAKADANSTPEQIKKKRETDKKRLLIYAAIFFIFFTVYFSDESKTIKENAKLERGEDEEIAGKPKKKTSKKDIKAALADYLPNYVLDTQQRKDAEIFFRNGVRELQNKNFRRAFTAFETALTVDPSHDLAKIYLKSAKKQMIEDLTSTRRAAIRSQKALRYKEARMHFQNIIRYLEGEAGNNGASVSEGLDRDEVQKLYEAAKKGIEELDKEENKVK